MVHSGSGACSSSAAADVSTHLTSSELDQVAGCVLSAFGGICVFCFGRLAVGEMRVLSVVLNEPLWPHPLLQFTSFFLSPLWLILRMLDDGIV